MFFLKNLLFLKENIGFGGGQAQYHRQELPHRPDTTAWSSPTSSGEGSRGWGVVLGPQEHLNGTYIQLNVT